MILPSNIDFCALFNDAYGLYYWKDRDFIYRGANQSFADFLNLPKIDQALNKRDEEYCWSEFTDFFREEDKKAIEGKSVISVHKVLNPKHDSFNVISKKIPLRNKTKETIGIFAHTYGISPAEQKKMHTLQKIDEALFEQRKNAFYFIEENFSGLTRRESQCLFYFLRGKTIKEIATRLILSPRTVETHIDHIKLKLNVRTRSDLFDIAEKKGWIQIIPL